jgi:hypothetical protein
MARHSLSEQTQSETMNNQSNGRGYLAYSTMVLIMLAGLVLLIANLR